MKKGTSWQTSKTQGGMQLNIHILIGNYKIVLNQRGAKRQNVLTVPQRVLKFALVDVSHADRMPQGHLRHGKLVAKGCIKTSTKETSAETLNTALAALDAFLRSKQHIDMYNLVEQEIHDHWPIWH